MYGFELLFDKWVIRKDPAAKLNYGIDWTPWLPVGDSVASVVWELSGAITSPANSIVGNTTFIRIENGDLNESPMPSARAKITTALSAEVEPQTLYFQMVTK